MLDQLNIQVENPVDVYTWTMKIPRNFALEYLKGKYAFLSKVTEGRIEDLKQSNCKRLRN